MRRQLVWLAVVAASTVRSLRNVGSQVLTPPGVFVSVFGGGGHVDPAAGHLGQPLGLQQVAELVSALAVGDLAL